MCEYIILEDFIMDKYIYDNSNGLWYELQGDYYIPCLVLPAEKEERHIGVWGQRHLRYIREHRKVFYIKLLTSGKLQSHLADVEEQAQELFDHLMKQRAEREGITEKLKADNQMEWVGRMSNLLSNGAAPKDVQELLGHADVSTTMNIYAHATREAKRTSARLLDKVVGGE